MRYGRFALPLALASLAPLATARAQDPVPLAGVERATAARIAAGATSVGWLCSPGPDGAVGCVAQESEAVGFGDGRPGARLPVAASAAEPRVAQVQPSQQRVIVLAPGAGPGDAELAEIGRALAVDPASRDGLARWRAVVEAEVRAGRDPARLVPRILEEARLGSVGDDAQLANVDLQNALQKRQQTLQTLSNVSKSLHDTAMAVIRKIGG